MKKITNVSEVVGDVFDDSTNCGINVIIQSCNCFHTMGAGIAALIKRLYPEIYQADVDFSPSGDKTKLGKFSHAKTNDKRFWIVNLYSQYNCGGGGRDTDYNALIDGLELVKTTIHNSIPERFVLGIPYGIGSNLAGARWTIVRGIIESIFSDAKFKTIIVRLPSQKELD